MHRAKRIYDGTRVILFEPLPISSDTPVEVLVPEDAVEAEQSYWRQLLDLGLFKEVQTRPVHDETYEPIQVAGAPISQTIIEERR